MNFQSETISKNMNLELWVKNKKFCLVLTQIDVLFNISNFSKDSMDYFDKMDDVDVNILNDEDNEFIDETVVDLRSFSPMGAIAIIELLELPPQQKKANDWLMQQSKFDRLIASSLIDLWIKHFILRPIDHQLYRTPSQSRVLKLLNRKYNC